MRIVIGTGNAGKLREFQAVLGPLGLEVCAPPAAYAAMQVEEVGATFEANARIKLEALLRCTDCHDAALTDDSGLLVDALDGAPGVRSARYAQATPPMSQDAANRLKLLQALASVPGPQRGAQFVAMLALQLPGEPPQVFEGVCRGRIAFAEAGTGGFGYDPLFIPQGHVHAFAELPAAVKHAQSHRGAALTRLVGALKAQHRL
jgi:XTP/dITP diphosphohydrolase